MKKFILLLTAFVFASTAWAATEGKGGLPLGSAVPDFHLENVSSGTEFSPADFQGKPVLVVVFMCRHCPYVQHVKKALASIAKDYEDREVAVVGISSNNPKIYPEDAPASLSAMAGEEGFVFPLLFDKTQSVARAFGAKATPDVYIFDKDQKLVYHGQFDDTRPNSGAEATGADARSAIDALLAGKPVAKDQKPAIGCSIK